MNPCRLLWGSEYGVYLMVPCLSASYCGYPNSPFSNWNLPITVIVAAFKSFKACNKTLRVTNSHSVFISLKAITMLIWQGIDWVLAGPQVVWPTLALGIGHFPQVRHRGIASLQYCSCVYYHWSLIVVI